MILKKRIFCLRVLSLAVIYFELFTQSTRLSLGSDESAFAKVEKWLLNNEHSDDAVANFQQAALYAGRQEHKRLFKDKKLVEFLGHWRELIWAKEEKICRKKTLRALNYVTKDVVRRSERLSKVLKPLAMDIASQCANGPLEEILERVLKEELSTESKDHLYKLLTDEFILEHKQLERKMCKNDAATQLIKSACNSPYSSVDKLARAIMSTVSLPRKIAPEGALPANLRFSSFAHIFQQHVVWPCREFVEKSWDLFLGLANLADYWEDGRFYEQKVANKPAILNNLFRFNMCRQIRNDQQLAPVLLTIIGKLRGEI